MAETFCRYGGVFKPQPMDQIVAMYMAQIPPDETIPWKWVKMPPATPEGNPGEPTITIGGVPQDSNELEELLEAIFDLKGSTSEIFKLKAKAFIIKAKMANDGL